MSLCRSLGHGDDAAQIGVLISLEKRASRHRSLGAVPWIKSGSQREGDVVACKPEIVVPGCMHFLGMVSQRLRQALSAPVADAGDKRTR